MDKRSLTERDICTKFILPAVKRAGWDEMVQVREEVYFTKGRIIVRGKLVTRWSISKAVRRPPARRHGAAAASGRQPTIQLTSLVSQMGSVALRHGFQFLTLPIAEVDPGWGVVARLFPTADVTIYIGVFPSWRARLRASASHQLGRVANMPM
jgi:hypothetical protein